MASITTGNLRQDRGQWWIVLTGKGSKTRRVKCHDTLFQGVETWAKNAGLTLGEGDELLFCNVTKGGKLGQPLNDSVIGRIVASTVSLRILPLKAAKTA